MTTLLMMFAALVIDHWLGEPRRWHPLVGFGRLAAWCEHHFNRGGDSARFLKGAMSWAILVSLPALAVSGVQQMLTDITAFIAGSIVLWLCIARRSLRDHVEPIADALASGNLEEARRRTGHIVSRDTQDMTEDALSRAATESVLENGNDAVIAPLFWFLLAGPVGCVAHRAINTLDAMWGYRNARYEWFGKWAARMDDVAAWLPARLTACGYALAGNTGSAIAAWRRDAAQLPSPNGGPCMTAGAGALGIRLGGPCHYHGQLKPKPLFGGEATCTASDIGRAIRLLDRCILFNMIFALVLMLMFSVAGMDLTSVRGVQ